MTSWIRVFHASISYFSGFILLCLCSLVFGVFGGLLALSTQSTRDLRGMSDDDGFHQQYNGISEEAKKHLKHILVKEKGKAFEDQDQLFQETCSICLCEFVEGQQATILSCCHLYHDSCLNPWLERNHRCPLCQKDLNATDPELVKNVKLLRSATVAPDNSLMSRGENHIDQKEDWDATSV